jgi:hypothetical protein
MDQYEQAKFTQLALANKCNVLLFTKDKFSNLGKKLRPEFDKLFLSSELKDCLKLLGNAAAEGSEPRNAVDLVRLSNHLHLNFCRTSSCFVDNILPSCAGDCGL